jgi:hypothetical protein
MTVLKMTKEQRKNAPLAFLSQHRAEMAEIARAKLRQAKAHHTPYNPQSERVVELISEWSSGFVS